MKVLLFFWKQIMWYSEVGAKENIRPEKPCGGCRRKKVSRKTQIGNARWRNVAGSGRGREYKTGKTHAVGVGGRK